MTSRVANESYEMWMLFKTRNKSNAKLMKWLYQHPNISNLT
jgi:hypothetical protein